MSLSVTMYMGTLRVGAWREMKMNPPQICALGACADEGRYARGLETAVNHVADNTVNNDFICHPGIL